jgi:hypothetical protein
MSPEQARSKRLDARTDLYSVGTILYEMLTGDVPFREDGFMGVLTAHITKPVPPMRLRAPDAAIPAGVEAVVMKALAKDPNKRWQSARELADALRAIPEDAVASRGTAAPKIAAAVGLLAILGGGAYWQSQSGSEPEPAAVMAADAAPLGETVPTPPPAPTPAAPVEAEPLGTPPAPEPSEPAPAAEADAKPGGAEESPTATTADPPRRSRRKRKTSASRPKSGGNSAISGPLSSADMKAGLAKARSSAKACGQKSGGLAGMKVKVEYEIAPDGTVKKAAAQRPMSGTPLGACAEDALESQRFPRSTEGARGKTALPVG